MKKLLTVIVVVVLAIVVFTQWGRLRGLIGKDEAEAAAVEPRTSKEAAESAQAKLESLKAGEVDRIALHAIELQSLLQFKYVQLLPAFVDSPQVKMEDGKLQVMARIPVEHLPTLNELGEAAGFLPDTTELSMTGSLLPLDSGRIALSIEQVRAARIPLPSRLVPKALERLGRKPEKGLPKNALALPLPGGIASAEVKGDSLIFYARPQPASSTH